METGDYVVLPSPVAVPRSVQSGRVRTALDVVYTGRGVGVVRIGLAGHRLPGRRAHRERIVGNLPQITGAHQLVERGRIHALVRVVLIDRVAQVEEVCFQHGFARVCLAVAVLHEADAGEDDQNRRDDEELDQGKAALASLARSLASTVSSRQSGRRTTDDL